MSATLILDPNGIHKIGGTPKSNFIFPKVKNSPVVYIGFLSKE